VGSEQERVEPRISVITLGVADVPRAREFYRALGWSLSGPPEETVAFFQNAGSRLALYPLQGLAQEAGQTPAPPGSLRATLAINVESKELVDQILARVVRVGAQLLQPAQDRSWGGYSGYFADPDGHAWEVAYNPFWPIGPDGLPQLP
jgi:predicted lactoylglutathione lyase